MLFGITPLGWVHTLGSLPAVPVAVYMLARHGRIVPRSKPGIVYFVTMLIGSISIFPIAHAPVAKPIAITTMFLLFVGYGVSRTTLFGRATKYIEVISLTITTFLLLLPSISETLRRVPNGHPLVTDVNSPVLKGVMAGLGVALLIGIALQVVFLRRGRLVSQSQSVQSNDANYQSA